MKKLLGVLVFLGLFMGNYAHALMGFMDGALFNEQGELQYMCFQDGSCIDKENNQTTREALGLGPVPQTILTPSPNTFEGNYVNNTVQEPVQQVQNPVVQPVTPSDTTAPNLKGNFPSHIAGSWNSFDIEADEPVTVKVWMIPYRTTKGVKLESFFNGVSAMFPDSTRIDTDQASQYFKKEIENNNPLIIKFTSNSLLKSTKFLVKDSGIVEGIEYRVGVEIKDASGNTTTNDFNWIAGWN